MSVFDAVGCVLWGALGGSIVTMGCVVYVMGRRVP